VSSTRKARIDALAQKVSKMRGKLRARSADGSSDVVALAPNRRNFLDHESKEKSLMAMKKATRKKAGRKGRRKGGRKKATKKGRKGGRKKGRRKK
jgi:hypothetical protein